MSDGSDDGRSEREKRGNARVFPDDGESPAQKAARRAPVLAKAAAIDTKRRAAISDADRKAARDLRRRKLGVGATKADRTTMVDGAGMYDPATMLSREDAVTAWPKKGRGGHKARLRQVDKEDGFRRKAHLRRKGIVGIGDTLAWALEIYLSAPNEPAAIKRMLFERPGWDAKEARAWYVSAHRWNARLAQKNAERPVEETRAEFVQRLLLMSAKAEEAGQMNAAVSGVRFAADIAGVGMRIVGTQVNISQQSTTTVHASSPRERRDNWLAAREALRAIGKLPPERPGPEMQGVISATSTTEVADERREAGADLAVGSHPGPERVREDLPGADDGGRDPAAGEREQR